MKTDLTRRTALAALLTPFSRAIYAQRQASKPNFVFIMMDNLGYGEVGVYGGGITRDMSKGANYSGSYYLPSLV